MDEAGLDVYQSVTPPGGDLQTVFSFQCDEPYFKVSGPPRSTTDFDIYLCLDDRLPVNAANCPGVAASISIYGHSNAAGTEAVGAVFWFYTHHPNL